MTCFRDMNTMTIKLNDFISCQLNLPDGTQNQKWKRIYDSAYDAGSRQLIGMEDYGEYEFGDYYSGNCDTDAVCFQSRL